MRKTYVDYSVPGSFFAEHDVREVSNRNVDEAVKNAPNGAFVFSFYDIVTVEQDGVELESKPLERSSNYYIDAQVLTVADIEAMNADDSYRILLINMRCNDWSSVLKCRTGNFQPMQDGDIVVHS